ncbi:MAG TPA: hypothetical protein VG711_02435, partial [Phycisphaerales bacterium]|nr:hypothetical protein [Phycisphaerales bacterium]
IPKERKSDSTSMTVQVTPSMAVTMLDALPYLIDYPYGCTEQTMSRFLPAAITAKTLSDLKLDAETGMSRAFGGIVAEHADKTHPKGKKSLDELSEMTKQSLDRLYDFQHGDGGWGWWKGGESDHFMSAYVLWGLCVAKEAGIDIRADVMNRANDYLDKELVEEERNADMQAWMLHACAAYVSLPDHAAMTEFQHTAIENLWKQKDRLNAYTRSLFALACHDLHDDEKAKTLVENLENGVKKDDRPDASVIIGPMGAKNPAVMATAHWGEDGVWWRWSDGPIESTAFALRAMLAIDPKNELIEPVTNWLVKNRREAQWSNTRDTAIAILALNDYLKASGELNTNLEYEVQVNGKTVASKKVTPADVLSAPSEFAVDSSLIQDGMNSVRIVKKSGDMNAPIYFAAHAEFFSLEEPVPASGNEIFVRRNYYKMVPKPTLLKGVTYTRMPLQDGGEVNSGERVEVLLTIESKNDYDYLLFEDNKAAGMEATEVRSGGNLAARELKSGAVKGNFGAGDREGGKLANDLAVTDVTEYTNRSAGVYEELRDRHTALFISHLPQGVWQIRYELRAEIPGTFHALPVVGHAMYVPEIRANSTEERVTIHERVEQ